MGPGTHEIPVALYALNRRRLVEKLRVAMKLKGGNPVVLLQGGSEIPFYDTDTNYVFRQVSAFPVSARTSFRAKSKASNRPKVVFHIFAATGRNGTTIRTMNREE